MRSSIFSGFGTCPTNETLSACEPPGHLSRSSRMRKIPVWSWAVAMFGLAAIITGGFFDGAYAQSVLLQLASTALLLIPILLRGEVLLTCRVSRKRVLLSHFDEWHAVLNANVPHPETRRVPMPYGSDDPPYGEWITPSAVERVLGHLRRTPQGSAGSGFHEVVSFLHGGLRS
jgi:hypothetical protein